MKKVSGKMLYDKWHSRSTSSRKEILDHLRSLIDELCSIPTPDDAGVASTGGGSVYDERLPSRVNGSYKTVREFHEALTGCLELATTKELPGPIARLFEFYREYSEESVLTHGDLNSLNVMISEETNRVTGILDWEHGGWFPVYWKYTCAKNVNFRNKFWAEEIDNFLEPMPDEFEIDKIRQAYFSI